MASLVSTGGDILPLPGSRAGWELTLAEPPLCPASNFPTARVFGAALGNTEAQLRSAGRDHRSAPACRSQRGPAGAGTALSGVLVSPGFSGLCS